MRISTANEGLMRSCDALIANLTPFRGVSMDTGTAFEVGFMRALGRPVLGYTNVVADYRERAEQYRRASPGLPDADASDIQIEDFDCAENLMIEAAILAGGGQVVRTAVPSMARRCAILPGSKPASFRPAPSWIVDGVFAMKLYVDADACPVKDEAVRVAERHGIEIHFVSNAGCACPKAR